MEPSQSKIAGFFLIISMLLPLCAQASEEVDINLSVSLLQEENINRGFFETDVHEDQVTQFTAGLKTELEINRLSAFFISIDYIDRSYSDYDKLSSSQFTGRVDYVFQTGYRFSNPSYTLSFSIDESDYGSLLRDSTTLSLSAKMLKRFTTRIKLSTGLALIEREADTNVFDIETTRLFVLLDYSITPKWSLYGSAALHDGGSVSTITTTDPDLLAQQIGYATVNEADAAGALLPDDAFGGAVAGQFAYQNNAETTILELGTNYILASRQSVDFSMQTISTSLDTGLEYDNFLLQLSYLARF